jgi:Na+-driven multidrug efflux pump
VLLVPALGAAGGAIATTVSYLVAIFWGLALFRRHARLSWRTLLQPDWLRLARDLVSPWQRLAR